MASKKILTVLEKILIAIIILASLFVCAMAMSQKTGYIAGKNGSKCYIRGHEHGNLIYVMEFESIEECEDFINLEPIKK